MDITLKDINPSDQILIRTQNSEYRFSVVDPVERRGTLSGGFLGTQPRDAVLVGTLSEPENNSSNSLDNVSNGLKTGRRALFYLTAKNGIERLITSIITGISRNQLRDDDKRAA